MGEPLLEELELDELLELEELEELELDELLELEELDELEELLELEELDEAGGGSLLPPDPPHAAKANTISRGAPQGLLSCDEQCLNVLFMFMSPGGRMKNYYC